MTSMTGSHALVTGASRGVGRATVRALHAAGARVSAFARNASDLQALRQELGDRCIIFAGDLCREADIDAALAHFTREQGPIDVLVNNAGIGAYRPFLERPLQELLDEIDVNFRSLVMLTHKVAQSMAARRSGTIINVASDLARKPLANMAVYTATKHAVAGLSQSLARELKLHGVRVALVNPGIIDTHFGGRQEGDAAGPGALRAEDVARAITFMVQQPAGVLIDELTLHPLGQDF